MLHRSLKVTTKLILLFSCFFLHNGFFCDAFKTTSPLFLLSFSTSALHSVLKIDIPLLDLAAPSPISWPLWSLCRPSFSGSVWCVSVWSFCARVHPVDRKHPVHHHSQLPVGSAGSVWPICVIFCQITGVWLHMIRPSPNHLPGERGREAGERKVQAGQWVLHWLLCLRGLSGDSACSPLLSWDHYRLLLYDKEQTNSLLIKRCVRTNSRCVGDVISNPVWHLNAMTTTDGWSASGVLPLFKMSDIFWGKI